MVELDRSTGYVVGDFTGYTINMILATIAVFLQLLTIEH